MEKNNNMKKYTKEAKAALLEGKKKYLRNLTKVYYLFSFFIIILSIAMYFVYKNLDLYASWFDYKIENIIIQIICNVGIFAFFTYMYIRAKKEISIDIKLESIEIDTYDLSDEQKKLGDYIVNSIKIDYLKENKPTMSKSLMNIVNFTISSIIFILNLMSIIFTIITFLTGNK